MDETSANGDIAPVTTGSGSAPEPATTTETVASTGSPTIAGSADQPGSVTTDATTPGPIPYERFEQINRRMKDAEERWQGVERSWGDILKADPQQVRQMLGVVQRIAADPVEHAVQILTEAQQDDRFRAKVASQAARILGTLRQHQPKAEEPEPQPDLVAENGSPVMSASRLREWQHWNQRRQQAEFDAKLAETVAPFKSLVERQRQQELEMQTTKHAEATLQKARQWHGFKEHEADIAKVFKENPDFTLQDAYLHVLHTTILPALPAQAQAKVVADLQSKAAAQTLNPASTARPSTPDFKGDFKAALEWAAANKR